MPGPEVTRRGGLGMQVCVPKNWTDNQVVKYANSQNPAGTTLGWTIRRQGDEALKDCDERVQCAGRKGFVHIMLDC